MYINSRYIFKNVNVVIILFCYTSYTKITSRKLLYMFSYFNSGSRFKNFLKNGRYLTTFANTLLVDCTVLPRSLRCF